MQVPAAAAQNLCDITPADLLFVRLAKFFRSNTKEDLFAREYLTPKRQSDRRHKQLSHFRQTRVRRGPEDDVFAIYRLLLPSVSLDIAFFVSVGRVQYPGYDPTVFWFAGISNAHEQHIKMP